jgi:nitrate reductase delta subunit
MMAHSPGEQHLYHLFAELLDYPRADLTEAARECQSLVSLRNSEATALLDEFRAFAETTPVERLQEVYSVTFDLDASCHPYVGYYLFGETYKRSVFLLGLKERFKPHGFTAPENELPDHLVVLLRFLAVCDDTGMVGDIVEEALLPALARMVKGGDEAESPDEGAGQPNHRRSSRNPYQQVLQALQLVLQSLSTNDQRLMTANGQRPTAATSVAVGPLS